MSTENLKELRNALSCWQDDYDCDDDKEQYDMFGAAIDAVSRLEAAERAKSAQSDHINQQQDRIDSLEQKNAALGNALGTAERERDELRASLIAAGNMQSIHRDACQKSEAELARRDAAAGEPVAWQYRYNDGKVGDWHTVDSESECNHHPFYERRPIYTTAQPAVLLQSDIDRIVPAIDPAGLDEAKHYIEHALYVDRERIRSELKELGAQQQKVVELYKRKSMEVISGQRYSYVLLEDLLPELDAANVKWEVKK